MKATRLLPAAGVWLVATNAWAAEGTLNLPADVDVSGSPTGIVAMPAGVDQVFSVFDRYTKVLAPNGKPIHIVVEPGYADRQVVYARKVLVNHLTNIPGSAYGVDKTTVANSIANMGAILFLFKDTETFERHIRLLAEKGVRGQDLRAYETILEGTPGYMAQKDPRRDASYEEIMHFVQGYGIEPAHPTLSQALMRALRDAQARDLYLLPHDESFEYFICGFEAYYDMWAHDPEGDGTRENEYVPVSQERLRVVDPQMHEIVEGFMGTHWLYTAEVVPEYEGTFSLTRNEELTYTHKSQHLRRAMLTGDAPSGLTGNDGDNLLFGNSGDNTIHQGRASTWSTAARVATRSSSEGRGPTIWSALRMGASSSTTSTTLATARTSSST